MNKFFKNYLLIIIQALYLTSCGGSGVGSTLENSVSASVKVNEAYALSYSPTFKKINYQYANSITETTPNLGRLRLSDSAANNIESVKEINVTSAPITGALLVNALNKVNSYYK